MHWSGPDHAEGERSTEFQRHRYSHHDYPSKFEGNLSLDIDSGISQTHHILNETHVLWQAQDSLAAIPSHIPFDIQLTSDFVSKDGQRSPLPPTVEFSFPPPSSLRARATYAMTIKVDRRKKHGVLPRSKS